MTCNSQYKEIIAKRLQNGHSILWDVKSLLGTLTEGQQRQGNIQNILVLENPSLNSSEITDVFFLNPLEIPNSPFLLENS
jgi:hypothetical protein